MFESRYFPSQSDVFNVKPIDRNSSLYCRKNDRWHSVLGSRSFEIRNSICDSSAKHRLNPQSILIVISQVNHRKITSVKIELKILWLIIVNYWATWLTHNNHFT